MFNKYQFFSLYSSPKKTQSLVIKELLEEFFFIYRYISPWKNSYYSHFLPVDSIRTLYSCGIGCTLSRRKNCEKIVFVVVSVHGLSLGNYIFCRTFFEDKEKVEKRTDDFLSTDKSFYKIVACGKCHGEMNLFPTA